MHDLWRNEPRPEHAGAVDVWGIEEVAVVRPKPRVEQGMLTLWNADGEQRIAVGAPEWFQWVETATMFAFASAQGTFTARREHSSSGRGGWYWRAYHDHAGRRQRAYLGVAAEISL